MPHRYKRILSASTCSEFRNALSYAEQEHYHTTLFLGARCYQSVVGPPQTKGRGARWFDEVQDPDQLWLPFERYTPVKIQGVYPNCHLEYGDGWVIIYQNSRHRDQELVYHVNQTEGPDRMIALSLYRQVEVQRREEPIAPTPFSSGLPLRRQLPPYDNSAAVPAISRRLSGVLAMDYVRTYLENQVSDIMEASLTMTPSTGIFYNERDDVVGHVIQHTQTPSERRIRFQIALHAHPENAYRVDMHCPWEMEN